MSRFRCSLCHEPVQPGTCDCAAVIEITPINGHVVASRQVELIEARKYYGRHATGWVALVNGHPNHFTGTDALAAARRFIGRVKVFHDQHRAVFDRWLADGTTVVCVFENHDLGHPGRGRRMAMPFDALNLVHLTIGKTRMPDTPAAIGWRYTLVAIATTTDEAVEAMKEKVT